MREQECVLAVDVENGLTRLGMFAADKLVFAWEVSTPRHITSDEAGTQLRRMLGEQAEGAELKGAILSCVVPSHSDAWTQALREVSPTRPLVMGPGLKTGLRVRVESPSEVGSDRVANVVAAKAAFGSPVVVVSLGTTTNVEVVDSAGSFVGGAIAPGVMLCARALSEAAAKLPLVELQTPRSAVGKNTREAIQAGVVLGGASLVDGLLCQVFEKLGTEAPVVVTGHHAEVLQPHIQHDCALDKTLTLCGLAHVWNLNRRNAE